MKQLVLELANVLCKRPRILFVIVQKAKISLSPCTMYTKHKEQFGIRKISSLQKAASFVPI